MAKETIIHGGDDVHVCPHPKFVQLMSHGSELFALDDHGQMFVRKRDPKDFNQGPHSQPGFLWIPVPGPLEG